MTEAEQFPGSEQQTIHVRVDWARFRPMKKLAAQERPGISFGKLSIEDAVSFVVRGLAAASLKNTRLLDLETNRRIIDARKDGIGSMENAINKRFERIPDAIEAGRPLTLEVTFGNILGLVGIEPPIVRTYTYPGLPPQ